MLYLDIVSLPLLFFWQLQGSYVLGYPIIPKKIDVPGRDCFFLSSTGPIWQTIPSLFTCPKCLLLITSFFPSVNFERRLGRNIMRQGGPPSCLLQPNFPNEFLCSHLHSSMSTILGPCGLIGSWLLVWEHEAKVEVILENNKRELWSDFFIHFCWPHEGRHRHRPLWHPRLDPKKTR
jgi:hypothetical protein